MITIKPHPKESNVYFVNGKTVKIAGDSFVPSQELTEVEEKIFMEVFKLKTKNYASNHI